MGPWELLFESEPEDLQAQWRAHVRAQAERDKKKDLGSQSLASDEPKRPVEPTKVATGKIPPKKPASPQQHQYTAPKGGPARPDPRAELIKRRAALAPKKTDDTPTDKGKYGFGHDDVGEYDPKGRLVRPEKPSEFDSPLMKPTPGSVGAGSHDMTPNAVSAQAVKQRQAGAVQVDPRITTKVDPKRSTESGRRKALYNTARRAREGDHDAFAALKRTIDSGGVDDDLAARLLDVAAGGRTRFEKDPSVELDNLAYKARTGNMKASVELDQAMKKADQKTKDRLLAIVQGQDPEHWEDDSGESDTSSKPIGQELTKVATGKIPKAGEKQQRASMQDVYPEKEKGNPWQQASQWGLSRGGIPPTGEPKPPYQKVKPSHPEFPGKNVGQKEDGYLGSKWEWDGSKWNPLDKFVPVRSLGKPERRGAFRGQVHTRPGEAPRKKTSWYDKEKEEWRRATIQGKPEKADEWVWDGQDWVRSSVFRAGRIKDVTGQDAVKLPPRPEKPGPELHGRIDPKRDRPKGEKGKTDEPEVRSVPHQQKAPFNQPRPKRDTIPGMGPWMSKDIEKKKESWELAGQLIEANWDSLNKRQNMQRYGTQDRRYNPSGAEVAYQQRAAKKATRGTVPVTRQSSTPPYEGPYDASRRYNAGDTILHPKGRGQVVQSGESTVDVQFPTGIMKLAHGKTGSSVPQRGGTADPNKNPLMKVSTESVEDILQLESFDLMADGLWAAALNDV